MSSASVDALIVKFTLRWQGRQMQARLPLPVVPLSPRSFVPMAQQLASAVSTLAEQAVKDQGLEVSCKAGCGACCRQVVPVSETEARHLRDLIEEMPEPRRQTVRDRFTAGRQKLADSGMLDTFLHPADKADRVGDGLEYFRLGIPCPFLEDESCSIHAGRPVSCREYLVTSPAEHCSAPTRETVRTVPLPTRPFPAMSAMDGPTADGGTRWVPMILAPEWADRNPDPEPTATGVQLFERFANVLNEQKYPGSPDPVSVEVEVAK